MSRCNGLAGLGSQTEHCEIACLTVHLELGADRPHVLGLQWRSGADPFLLTTSPPSRSQWQLAICMLVILVAALLVTAPFARIPLKNTEVLLPAYAAAVFVNELITSALLLALFSVQRSRAVLTGT